jgi:N-acetylmuramoyl-L-alanine amidase
MGRRALVAAAATLLACCASGAQAQVGATGTRVSIAGATPRFYMTYGHAEDPELYAPIGGALARLLVTFQQQGEDLVLLYRGAKVDQFPIVTTRELLPETGEHPAALSLGGQLYLPVRHIATRLGLNVDWDKRTNMVNLVPGGRPVKTQVAQEPAAPAAGPVVLSVITVEQVGGTLTLRVKSSAPVSPVWTTIRSPKPYRIALDFPGATWAKDVQVPAPTGNIQGFRIGHPKPEVARLAMDIPSLNIKVTRVEVLKEEVTAVVGLGVEARTVQGTPEIIGIVRRQRLASRSGNWTLTPPDGTGNTLPIQPPVGTDLNPAPETGNPLKVRPVGSLSGKCIVVDAGHGGDDPGAPGKMSKEKNLTLQMCLALKRELEERGARVVLTRDADEFVSLQSRVAIANNCGADLFISIHMNAMPRPNLQSGSETYYYLPHSRRLARALHGRVVGTVRGRDGGIRNNRALYVCRKTAMPSVLLEIGYINHERDEALLNDAEFQTRLAGNLAQGVMDYFGTDLSMASP